MAKKSKSQPKKKVTETKSDISNAENTPLLDDMSSELDTSPVGDDATSLIDVPEDLQTDADAEILDALPPDAADTSMTEPAKELGETPEIEPVSEVMEPAYDPEPAVRAAPEHADSASNSVLLPAILGGLIAAGIGFAVAYYSIPRANPNLNEMVAANTSAVSDLRGELETTTASLTEAVDLTEVTATLDSLQSEIQTGLTGLTGRIDEMDERILTLEKQPSGDGTLQEAALQAYQRELDEIRAQVEEQASAAFDQLRSTREEAAQIEQAALDAARAAQIRAALAQVQTALTDGEPMQAALTDLEDALGEPVPAALAAVAGGTPTLAKLQADFPNAARLALRAARSDDASGEDTSAFGSFLREQLNVRSVAPREGDDADAILSRAQAAVSDGKLQVALDELAGLPDVAAGPLAEWVTIAETRVAAVEAADSVSLSLNVN